jgi:hypothetical protein
MLLSMADDSETKVPKFIRRTMPAASEAELRESTATFEEYMVVVWEIFQRISREQEHGDSQKLGFRDRVDDIQPSV